MCLLFYTRVLETEQLGIETLSQIKTHTYSHVETLKNQDSRKGMFGRTTGTE